MTNEPIITFEENNLIWWALQLRKERDIERLKTDPDDQYVRNRIDKYNTLQRKIDGLTDWRGR